jgi:hypothetical protein
MATCNLCGRDVSDDEIEEHRRTVHPDVDADGTRRSDRSRIVPDVTAPRPPEDA